MTRSIFNVIRMLIFFPLWIVFAALYGILNEILIFLEWASGITQRRKVRLEIVHLTPPEVDKWIN